MSLTSSSKRLKQSTFKLNALLTMAQAISADLKTENLLQRFGTILNDDLGIDRVLFYKKEETWELLLKTNCPDSVIENIDVERDLMAFNEITIISTIESSVLQELDIIIPVIQNNTPLAYILIGDTNDFEKGVSASIRHLNFVQTLSIIIFVAIENLRLFYKSLEQEAIRKELELASKMQNMLIPSPENLPKNEKLKITTYYNPHYEVGGDYYDVIELSPGEIGFCIADVSGKGISAALLMSNFQANLRALFTHEIRLTKLAEKLNERVMATAKGEKFITIFIGRFNVQKRHLEYINAGHNPPLLYNKISKQINQLTSGCVGLGMLDEIPVMNVGSILIGQPSKLICFTDGLVEFLSENKIENGTKAIETNISNASSLEDNIKFIVEAQEQDSGNNNIVLFDDISILGFEFL
ncbi:MAG: SpoIIE family protein phosphatase [Bacteroidales bacterium]|nr:SpoIIE family protein phosphatase [Bacteroidales bacterium]